MTTNKSRYIKKNRKKGACVVLMRQEEIQMKTKMLWAELNKRGIYTEEELDKALKEKPINIAIFVIDPDKHEKRKAL